MKFIRANLLLIINTLAVTFLILSYFFFSTNKIAYVDSAKLLTGYKAMVQARSEFDEKQKTWGANIDSLTNDVKDAIQRYEKTAALGTEKEKQLSKELITGKQRQLYEYQNAIKQNASQEEQRLTQNVLSTVNAFLLRYGKKHGYKIVFIAANGNIAYADQGMDITDKVVEQLNKEYAVPAK